MSRLLYTVVAGLVISGAASASQAAGERSWDGGSGAARQLRGHGGHQPWVEHCTRPVLHCTLCIDRASWAGSPRR